MADKEKIVNGLECCSESSGYGCNYCPYGDECRKATLMGCAHLCRDALELLKEQEPVHVQKREFAHMWFWCCGSCGVAITEGDRFCRMCGKEMKWDTEGE